jgi:hypothetical protein
VACGFAVISSTGPAADAVVTDIVVVLLVLGGAAGLVGHRVHVLRIRRDIDAGRGMVMRREPIRAPVCHDAQRGRGRRRIRCRPGRTRYR